MQILTMDIGGTSVKCALVDQYGTLSQPSYFETLMDDLGDFGQRLNRHLSKHYGEDKFVGIGISCTGIARPNALTIGEGNPIFKAFGQTLAKDLQRIYQVPVAVENDGNCSLLAEHWLGAGKGSRHLASIVIGTSIGGAVIIHDQIYHGHHYMAGEFGYGLLQKADDQWEIWANVGSTAQIYKKHDQARDGKSLMALYEKGDPLAQALLREMTQKVAVMAYNIQYFLDPEKILIGGGISESSHFIDLVKEALLKMSQQIDDTVRIPVIQASQFGNQAHLIGAAKHWLNTYMKD